MEIVDGRRNFGASLREIVERGHLATKAGRVGVQIPPLSEIAKDARLQARIYRNQWIVDCPDCRNAEFAFLADPWFMCSDCFNAAVGGQWRPVEFPENRAEIEAAIKARPLPHNRNWSPSETVAGLRRENREHGLPDELAQEVT